jgi:hypothetical protein
MEALWALLGTLVDHLIRGLGGLPDTAFGLIWATFGLFGISGLWLWVIMPLRSRASRAVIGAFLALGVIAATPWAVAGVRQTFWPGLLLAVACFMALAVLVALLRPNNTPHSDAHASALLDQRPSARADGHGR